MRFIGRLIALLWLSMIVSAIVGTIAARAAKRRIVPVDAPDPDQIRLAAIFGPISFRSTATAFRGGTIDCWYGGGVIDLRGTTLDPSGAHLQVKAVFGGGQILVPGARGARAREGRRADGTAPRAGAGGVAKPGDGDDRLKGPQANLVGSVRPASG